MLAIEQTRYQEAPQPSQFASRFDRENGRTEGHGCAAWWLDPDLQALAWRKGAYQVRNERIPGWVLRNVGERVPHALGRCVDADLRVEHFHRPVSPNARWRQR